MAEYNEKQRKIADEALKKMQARTQQWKDNEHAQGISFPQKETEDVALKAIKEIILAYEDEVNFTAKDAVAGFDPARAVEASRILKRLEESQSGDEPRELFESQNKLGRYCWYANE